MSDPEKKPWGHRVLVSIYVEGELPASVGDHPVVAAAQAATLVLEARGANVYYSGASTGIVEEKPKDQGGS